MDGEELRAWVLDNGDDYAPVVMRAPDGTEWPAEMIVDCNGRIVVLPTGGSLDRFLDG